MQRVRAAFEGHVFEVGERSMSATVSIGGVQIGEKIASVPQILAKANQCLQSAEGVGGNRIEIFDLRTHHDLGHLALPAGTAFAVDGAAFMTRLYRTAFGCIAPAAAFTS